MRKMEMELELNERLKNGEKKKHEKGERLEREIGEREHGERLAFDHEVRVYVRVCMMKCEYVCVCV